MPTNEEEYAYGLAQEHELKPFFDLFFGKNLTETEKWDPFDFVGENIKIELKSRRNTYSKYPTTIVGMYKINTICDLPSPIEHYFVFNFTDGVYYWKYNKDEFDNMKQITIKRRDRPGSKGSKYLSIPIGSLTKMEKDIALDMSEEDCERD